MISGKVHPQGEPPITGVPRAFIVVGNIADSARTMDVEVIVDTAFTAHLTLPPQIIRELGLPYFGERSARLANDEVESFKVYAAQVSWNGQNRMTPIFEVEGQPLLGMAMLWGSRLTVDAREGGDVVIEPLSPP